MTHADRRRRKIAAAVAREARALAARACGLTLMSAAIAPDYVYHRVKTPTDAPARGVDGGAVHILMASEFNPRAYAAATRGDYYSWPVWSPREA